MQRSGRSFPARKVDMMMDEFDRKPQEKRTDIHSACSRTQPRHVQKPKKKRTAKHVVLTVIFWLALAVMLVSAGVLIYELVIIPGQSHKSIQDFQSIYSRPNTSSSETVNEEDPSVLPEFLPLIEKNADTAGWLTIPNTTIDNPVFWTPDNQNYYLRRDADGNDNKLGSLFLSAGSTLQPQAQVMVAYGHNMEDNDEMFGQLLKFKKLDFLKENPTFTFDTKYRRGEWKIIAVCRGSVAARDEGSFVYYNTSYSDEESFNAFIRNARTRSLFHIDDDVNYSDSLLVFSTCEYNFWGDRFVVIARKLREGESASSVATGKYEVNPVILMPDSYYALGYIHETAPSQETVDAAYEKFYGTGEAASAE